MPLVAGCGGLVDWGPEGASGSDGPGTDPPNQPPLLAPVDLTWMRQFGSAGQDKASAVAFAQSGAVFVAGWTSLGEEDPAVPLGKTDSFVRRYDSGGEVEWSMQFGTTDSDGVYAAIGLGEEVVIGGYCRGALPGHHSLGDSDAYVSRLDGDGKVTWSRQFGTAGYDVAYGLAVDSAGALLVVGYVEQALAGQNSAGREDAFVARFTDRGDTVFEVQFGSDGPDVAFAVCAFEDGGFAVAGSTRGPLEGGTYLGKEDAFVRRYNVHAALEWSAQFGGPSKDVATSVVCAQDGSVLVGGYFYGELDGEPSYGSYDGFVRRYDQAGTVLGTTVLGSEGADYVHALAADAAGRTFATGSTEGELAGAQSGRSDSFVLTLDEVGNELGGWQFGSPEFGEARAISVSPDGRVATAGYTQGALEGQVSSGAVDAYAAVLD